jgi:hypothetical protein
MDIVRVETWASPPVDRSSGYRKILFWTPLLALLLGLIVPLLIDFVHWFITTANKTRSSSTVQ